MPRVQITDTRGLEQKTGTGVSIDSNVESTLNMDVHNVLTATSQHSAAGTLSVKIDKGIHHYPIIHTGPAPAASLADGNHTLTAVNLSKGYCIVTPDGGDANVQMPTKAHIIALFGGSGNITVGDSIVWSLHNAGTTANEDLILVVNTGQTIPANIAKHVGANAANASAATTQGTSTGRFQTRVTNVDGSTNTIRLA